MKQFTIDVDFTMSKRITVEAENEERAKAIINGWIKYNPYEYAHSFNAYVKHEITDVNEEEEDEERTELDKALDFVREQIGPVTRHYIRETATKNMEHRMPASGGIENTADKIQDLLEEYGADNELSEGWWMEYGDIDDVLVKL